MTSGSTHEIMGLRVRPRPRVRGMGYSPNNIIGLGRGRWRYDGRVAGWWGGMGEGGRMVISIAIGLLSMPMIEVYAIPRPLDKRMRSEFQ